MYGLGQGPPPDPPRSITTTSNVTAGPATIALLPAATIPTALQQLFQLLTSSTQAVATTALTQSFGWGKCDFAYQQDAQETMMLLLDVVESCSGANCDSLFAFESVFTTSWTHRGKKHSSRS